MMKQESGVYSNQNGLVFDVQEILKATNQPNTPENRNIAAKTIMVIASHLAPTQDVTILRNHS